MRRFSPSALGGEAVLALVLAALATAVVLAAVDVTAIRVAVGVPFVLYAPGRALVAAMFGSGEPEETPARLLLSVAVSVALAILLGLVLDAATIPLTGDAFVIALAAVTLAGVVLSAQRAHPVPDDEVRGRWRDVLRWPLAWSLALVAGVFAVLLVALSRPLPNTQVAGYTQLWAVHTSPDAVRIGVRNVERGRTRYRLKVMTSDGTFRSATFTLSVGEQWRRVLAPPGPERRRVAIRLYRTSAPERLYREVTVRA